MSINILLFIPFVDSPIPLKISVSSTDIISPDYSNLKWKLYIIQRATKVDLDRYMLYNQI